MKLPVFLIVSLLPCFAGCQKTSDEFTAPNQSQINQLEEYMALRAPHVITIPPASEPGEPLIVAGRLLRKEDNSVIPHQEIFAYHTDITGKYNEEQPGNEMTARLRGTVVTDEQGRFLLQTIFPQGYSGKDRSGAHIHLHIDAAKPSAYDIHFAQYSGAQARRFMAENDQFFMPEVYRLPTKELVVLVDVLVKNYNRG